MSTRHVVVLVAGLALGVGSLVIARGSPAASFGGGSVAAALVLLSAGWTLFACGVVEWARRPTSRFGPLLVAAGATWFLVEFNNPGVGSPVIFTIGLLTSAACPALVAHAAFAYPGGRLARRAEAAGLLVAYTGTILMLGLLPALVFDPASQGCSQCPRNLLALTSAPGLIAPLDRVGLLLGLVWAPALAALAVWRIVRSTAAARLLAAPVLLATIAYLGLVAVGYAHSLERGFLSNDSLDQRLWLGQAAALGALSLGVALAWARGWRARTAVARLVIELSDAPAPGGLRDLLARTLDDPALELAYPLGPGRYVDERGHSLELSEADGRAATPLVRGGRPVAILVHRAELLDDPGVLEDVGAAAGLALDRERLQAQTRAQLQQLRASRARTVEAGDAARRRLERDLHDGAQQRLVVLSFALRLLQAELDDDDRAGRLDVAEAELRAALAELRELARGIYPAVLIDEGLASAIEALAETAPVPIAIDSLPDQRFVPAVEAAAYFLVADIAKRGNTKSVTVRASRSDGRLHIEVESVGALDDDLVDLEDRIGALDGELTVLPTPRGSTTIRAELPCGS